MALVKSISGIRGTIGGRVAEGLSPVDVVRFTAAYATQRKAMIPDNKTIVVGRDARLSGEMVDQLVCGTLIGMGYDVINIGLATTPTTELAVTGLKAAGGIILTASHNPKQWNALKLLNEKGEFLNDQEGKEVLAIAEAEDFNFAEVDDLGHITHRDYLPDHVRDVMALELVDKAAIEAKNYTVAIDCVNSIGGLAIPAILRALGVKNIIELNCEPTGHFAHNPEPIPQNLTQISDLMREGKADVGFVVDPDVDRLAIICEDGEMFGEEYTLVSVADYVLSHTPGNTVSNIDLVYYLLYARYANSTIASISEEQFAYKVFSTIFMYGPTWEKRLEIQSKVRSLTEDEIIVGTKRIHNISMNPSIAPTTDTLDELTTINQQMTDGWKKSKLEGYGILESLLTTDVTEQFIGKFKKLFITVVEPTLPWWDMEV